MIFNYILGFQDIDKEKVNIIHREAVRAVIINKDNILLVRSNKGDYKFPGGGVNDRESYEEALIREVREETGYIVNNIKDKIGMVVERRIDEYQKDSIFEMISSYYLCEISDKQTHQQLDHYEAELDFRPEWVYLEKAVQLNEEILKKEDKMKNSWVHRETMVLSALKEHLHV